MDQKQIREEIEKLIKKSYKEIDKVFAERLKEILSQIKKLLMKIEGKDPHIGWTEINKFRRLDSELKRIEKDLEGDHKKIAENINNLKEKTYLDTFLKHTYLFEQATKDRFLTAIPDMKLVRKMLEQPIKFIKLDESLKKERKRALKRIRADITLGVLNGEGFKKIAKRLRTSLGMTVKQSKRVARTEGGRAMEQAAFDSAQVAKKYGARMHKIWEATLDLRTRPSHQVLDHQMKDIDEPFEINGCKGMHPKGFVGPGSAGENINCRCVVLYTVNGELPATRRAEDIHGRAKIIPTKSYQEWIKDIEADMKKEYNNTSESGAVFYFRDERDDIVKNNVQIKQEVHAYKFYNAIKNRNLDREAEKITANLINIGSGLTYLEVRTALEHIFENKYELSNGLNHFAPDYTMAQSLQRLLNGKNILEKDIILLQHEHLEHYYMNVIGMNYQDAHNETNKKYNFQELE